MGGPIRCTHHWCDVCDLLQSEVDGTVCVEMARNRSSLSISRSAGESSSWDSTPQDVSTNEEEVQLSLQQMVEHARAFAVLFDRVVSVAEQ